MAGKVTADLAESDGSLPLGFVSSVTCSRTTHNLDQLDIMQLFDTLSFTLCVNACQFVIISIHMLLCSWCVTISHLY